MSQIELAKQQVFAKLRQAAELIPTVQQSQSVITGGSGTVPWSAYERQVWGLGESIRQLMAKQPQLRNEPEITRLIVDIATNRQARRGRQAFILLLAYKAYQRWAPQIISHIKDDDVRGHIINALFKMQAGQFVDEVQPYATDSTTWIRKEAERYVKRYS